MGSWTTWETVTAEARFQNGLNTVRLTANGDSGANFELLEVQAATITAEVAATEALLVEPMVLIPIEGYIVVPNGNGNFGDGRADFNIIADTDTTVTIEAEIETPTGQADSFFVWFDEDDEPYAWHTGISTSFVWKEISISFTLSRGNHMLHIGIREYGVKLRALRIIDR